MKRFTKAGVLITAFLLASIAIFGQMQLVAPAALVPAEIEGYVYGTTLPFYEDWESGSFGSFWTHEENWFVNGQIGNIKPSAEFKWSPVLSEYTEYLMSGDINGISQDSTANPYIDGHIILEFDVKLNSVSSTGDEILYIEIWADSNWIRLKGFNNSNGSFDWLHNEIDITNIAFGKVFKIRFMAEGTLSSDILSWFIDNISIERVCYPPTDLTADGIDPFTMELNWIPPHVGAGNYNWIMWDDAVNVDGIGLTGGGVFSVASHWDPDMIVQYHGLFITKIRFFPYYNAINTNFTLKVWEGPDATTLIYEEPLSNVIAGEWNTVTLARPSSDRCFKGTLVWLYCGFTGWRKSGRI